MEKKTTIWYLLFVEVVKDWELYQMDKSNALLHGENLVKKYEVPHSKLVFDKESLYMSLDKPQKIEM